MSIKADRWIRRMAHDHEMIDPFVEDQIRTGVISYGLSSYGYDMRVAGEFKVFTNVFNVIVDRRTLARVHSWISRPNTVIFPRTHLPWPVQLSTFGFRAMCCAS